MAKIFYIITLAILLISCNSNNGKTKQVSTIDSTLQVSVDGSTDGRNQGFCWF